MRSFQEVDFNFCNVYFVVVNSGSGVTHRIQAWDFTNYSIPDISDSKVPDSCFRSTESLA